MNINTNLLHRLGRVRITGTALITLTNEQMLVLFSQFYPMWIMPSDRHVQGEEYIYCGKSTHFRELDEGEMVPYYEVLIKETEVTFTEIK